MNAKTTLVLAFIFMVIAGVATLDQFVWKQAREGKKAAENLVLSVAGEKVSAVTIKDKKREIKIACKKEGGCPFDLTGDWQVVAPISDDGDPSNIGSFLSSLKNLAPVGRVDAAQDEWGSFGLVEPAQSLEISLSSGKTLYLGFGEESAIGANRYLRTNTNDKEVYLVATYFPNQLGNDVFFWRNKRILRGIDAEAVERFTWNAGTLIAAEHKGKEWALVKPYRVDSNKIMVEGLLNTLLYANGTRILSEAGVPPPQAKRFLAAELILREGKKIKVDVFSLASKDAAMRVSGSKIIYSVDQTAFERFKKKFEEFRFQRLLTFDEKNAAEELVLRFPREKKTLALKREGGDWVRTSGVELKDALSQARIRNFLDTLAALDPERFTRDPAKWRKFQALADLEVVIGEKTLRFVLDGRKSALANGELSGEARIMGENFLKNLPVRLTDLYESTNKQVVVQEAEEHGREHDEHTH